MPQPTILEEHFKTISMTMDWAELREVLLHYLASKAGIRDALPWDKVEIKIEQIQKGNPPYDTQEWRAMLRVRINLLPTEAE